MEGGPFGVNSLFWFGPNRAAQGTPYLFYQERYETFDCNSSA